MNVRDGWIEEDENDYLMTMVAKTFGRFKSITIGLCEKIQ